MRMFRIYGLLLALAFGAAALAYPTLSGPTGQSVIPTAYIAGTGITLAGDWYELPDGNSFPLRALLSLGSSAEFGVAYDPFNSDAVGEIAGVLLPLDSMWGANAKVRFGRFLGGNGAIGAQFLRFRADVPVDETTIKLNNDFEQAYFAWTAGIRPVRNGDSVLNLTWGVNWTRFDPEEGTSDSAFRFFAGAELWLTRMIAISADYQTKKTDVGDTKAISAVAARICLNPNLALQVGTTNALGVIGQDDHNTFFGLAIALGGRAAPR